MNRRTTDHALVSATITSATLCAACIEKKTGVPADRIPTIVGTLGHTLKMSEGVALCDSCLSAKKVFRLV